MCIIFKSNLILGNCYYYKNIYFILNSNYKTKF